MLKFEERYDFEINNNNNNNNTQIYVTSAMPHTALQDGT